MKKVDFKRAIARSRLSEKRVNESLHRILSAKLKYDLRYVNPLLAKKANRIIVATFSASTVSNGQVKLVHSLQKSGKPLVVLSLGLPYDIKNPPQIGINLEIILYIKDRN